MKVYAKAPFRARETNPLILNLYFKGCSFGGGGGGEFVYA